MRDSTQAEPSHIQSNCIISSDVKTSQGMYKALNQSGRAFDFVSLLFCHIVFLLFLDARSIQGVCWHIS